MRNAETGIALIIVIVVIMLLCTLVGGWLWPYTVNTWLVYAGKEPTLVWWQGALMGFCPVLGQITIPVAIVTWVLMLFLG